ncbi:hypothetical protein [Paenibacillus sp. LHD-38]|uniref:hypothetical protein n=1 Tax=Paenibacillus sp. LHD-38 TaxID=3072143 RepID=UPI00280E4D87|nr:hypothetical protein [Paenibacillus sp. LHD-38]MDQ8733430.1 hypothetical protein [Paenibacillus sp. LHD-38]
MNNQTGSGLHPAVKFFEGEKSLVLTGLLGFLLAGICGVWGMLNGGAVAPDGDVLKAFSFNAALGIFLLSTAAVLPFSGMGKKSKGFFRWSYIVLAFYSYFAETVQNFRGVNPRFVQNGTAFDVAVGSIFTLVALLLVLFYGFLAIQYFRKKAYLIRPELVFSIRYAMIAIMVSFAAGLWISFNQGRLVGLHGNIIWLHGLGFHALQALPFVAWLTERQSLTSPVRRTSIHITGATYLLGLALTGWQTYLGNSIFEWSLLPVLAAGCFLAALVPAILMLRQKNFIDKSL